jgi:hypothetical protein
METAGRVLNGQYDGLIWTTGFYTFESNRVYETHDDPRS